MVNRNVWQFTPFVWTIAHKLTNFHSMTMMKICFERKLIETALVLWWYSLAFIYLAYLAFSYLCPFACHMAKHFFAVQRNQWCKTLSASTSVSLYKFISNHNIDDIQSCLSILNSYVLCILWYRLAAHIIIVLRETSYNLMIFPLCATTAR